MLHQLGECEPPGADQGHGCIPEIMEGGASLLVAHGALAWALKLHEDPLALAVRVSHLQSFFVHKAIDALWSHLV